MLNTRDGQSQQTYCQEIVRDSKHITGDINIIQEILETEDLLQELVREYRQTTGDVRHYKLATVDCLRLKNYFSSWTKTGGSCKEHKCGSLHL